MTRNFANVLILGLAVLAPLFSGCLGGGGVGGGGLDASAGYGDGGDGSLPETSEEAEITSELGALTGYVLTEEFTPIAGATLLLEEIGQTTSAALDGSYTFSLLQPGDYTLRANASTYEGAVRAVTVEGGAVLRESFQLVGIPGLHAHHELFEFKAFLECGGGFALTQKPAVDPLRDSANQVADAIEPLPLLIDAIIDRWIRLVPEEWNETQAVGLRANGCATLTETVAETPLDSASNDAFLFTWPHHDASIQEIVLELSWRSMGVSGREFDFVVEPVVPATEQADGQGDEGEMYYYSNVGYEYGRARGTSPARLTLDREDLERVTRQFNENETKPGVDPTSTSTGGAIMKPQDFTQQAWFMVRVFPVANQLGPDKPLDYALTFQQPLDLYVTNFYVEGAPEAYTAIPE